MTEKDDAAASTASYRSAVACVLGFAVVAAGVTEAVHRWAAQEKPALAMINTLPEPPEPENPPICRQAFFLPA